MKNWIAIIASFLFSTNVLFSQSPDFSKQGKIVIKN